MRHLKKQAVLTNRAEQKGNLEMATFSQVIEAAIEVAVKRAALAAHPVGSIIITNDPRNPSQYIGGGGRLSAIK